jgi:2-oxoglutarate/2-oxoacid ferredoxin oxidoreductase subunit alpha
MKKDRNAINIVIEICGSAGEGTISAGEILSRFMSAQGFEIMSFDAYPAEIRGFGKCVAHTRISTSPIHSPGKLADVLIALNDGHAISQLPALKSGGILIYDSQPPRPHEEDQSVLAHKSPETIAYGIPLTMLAQKAAGSARGRNMTALGAVAALFHLDSDAFTGSIEKRYAKKKQAIIDANVHSFLEGFDWARENIDKADAISFKGVTPHLAEAGEAGEKLIINGNQLVARAALDADLKFYAGYPITPATKIMEILSRELPRHGGVLLQTEDEISAIGAVIGAGYGGIRAMTGTSGPGFALMTEFTGLSVMAEVPAVIIDSQRGGPSTGIPTKTEQSDFNAAVFGGTGDCPRVVLAPIDTRSVMTPPCWPCTWRKSTRPWWCCCWTFSCPTPSGTSIFPENRGPRCAKPISRRTRRRFRIISGTKSLNPAFPPGPSRARRGACFLPPAWNMMNTAGPTIRTRGI